MKNLERGENSQGVAARLARLQPWYLLLRYPRRLTHSFFAFAGGTLAIGIMCVAAVSTGQAMIFPSLGPTAFLFFTQPNAKTATPRNAILSHWAGILVGAAAFFGGQFVFGDSSSTGRIITAAISLGAVSAVMIAFDIAHPPAASTTLLVSLGAMTRWNELLAVMLAIVLMTFAAFVINRLSGVAYPIWSYQTEQSESPFLARALQTESPTAKRNPYAGVADDLIGRRY
jgi:CBS domain-containing membrane protein